MNMKMRCIVVDVDATCTQSDILHLQNNHGSLMWLITDAGRLYKHAIDWVVCS